MTYKNPHVYYDSGGYYGDDYSKHIIDNIVYPEINTTYNEYQYFVPLVFNIGIDGRLSNIEFDSSKLLDYGKYKLTTDSIFRKEALRLLKLSGKWVPFLFEGEYVNRKCTLRSCFDYHPLYINSNIIVELNPTEKAYYNGDIETYNKIMNSENGCDGEVRFIFLVEKNGSVSHIHCLSCIGKTNPSIGLHYLKQLDQWKPAIHDDKPVVSQMILTIRV
jgi:hypothetical protein